MAALPQLHPIAKPQPFFLDGSAGRLCAMYHPPDPQLDVGIDLLHVHAFANELYDTRPILSYQARQLSASGVGVLLVDLFGCGDSEGDFGDASWNQWKQDLETGVNWLSRFGRRVGLWGTRCGALLLMDYVHQSSRRFHECILWQPVLSGEQYLTQFLRLRVAFSAMAERNGTGRISTKDLRDQFARGESVEVAGYELSPSLARGLDDAKLANLWCSKAGRLTWIEVPIAGTTVSPASEQVISSWLRQGATVQVLTPAVKPFWTYSRGQANEYDELVSLMRQIHNGAAK